MDNIQIMNETLNIDLISRILGIVTGIISFFTVLYTFYRLIIKRLNSTSKKYKNILKKAKIKPWKLKLFTIIISLDTVPSITRADKIFAPLMLCISLLGLSFSGYFIYKVSLIPTNWAYLTLKSSQEEFLITYDKATSADIKKSWSIDTDKCLNNKPVDIATENNISLNLAIMICSSIGKNSHDKELGEAIKKSEREKVFLYIIFTMIILQMLWLAGNTCMTLLYKKRLKKIIINEQNRAELYLT